MNFIKPCSEIEKRSRRFIDAQKLHLKERYLVYLSVTLIEMN